MNIKEGPIFLARIFISMFIVKRTKMRVRMKKREREGEINEEYSIFLKTR